MKKFIDYYIEMHVDGSGRVVLMREDSDDYVEEVAIVEGTKYSYGHSVTATDVQSAITADVLKNCIRVDYRQSPEVDRGDTKTTRYETPQYADCEPVFAGRSVDRMLFEAAKRDFIQKGIRKLTEE